MSKHLSDKLQSKLEKEGIAVKDNNVRFTVTHYDNRGKVLGRDWFKGYVAVSGKRMVLVADGKKFLNIKSSDERYSAVKFVEDNIACLKVSLKKEAESEHDMAFHIYSGKVDKLLKNLNKL